MLHNLTDVQNIYTTNMQCWNNSRKYRCFRLHCSNFCLLGKRVNHNPHAKLLQWRRKHRYFLELFQHCMLVVYIFWTSVRLCNMTEQHRVHRFHSFIAHNCMFEALYFSMVIAYNKYSSVCSLMNQCKNLIRLLKIVELIAMHHSWNKIPENLRWS
jgi:hypothetical protein